MKHIHTLNHSLIFASALMHVFCCGLPLLMTLGSVVTLLGFSAGGALDVSWFHAIEMPLFYASTVVLALTALIQWKSRQIDCIKDAGCHHEPCAPKKRLADHLFKVALAVYAINAFYLLVAHSH